MQCFCSRVLSRVCSKGILYRFFLNYNVVQSHVHWTRKRERERERNQSSLWKKTRSSSWEESTEWGFCPEEDGKERKHEKYIRLRENWGRHFAILSLSLSLVKGMLPLQQQSGQSKGFVHHFSHIFIWYHFWYEIEGDVCQIYISKHFIPLELLTFSLLLSNETRYGLLSSPHLLLFFKMSWNLWTNIPKGFCTYTSLPSLHGNWEGVETD